MGDTDTLLLVAPLVDRAHALSNPCPIPAVSGLYGWWFDAIPAGVPTADCAARGQWTLLYVGISPKAPPLNGAAPSRQTLRTRIRYHYRGNAEGSTLRLTLGVLLADQLGVALRRVGSGKRHTFSEGESDLSAWMADHARVSFIEHRTPWVLEEEMIASLDLPLNLDKNNHNGFYAELRAQRRAAKVAATALPVLAR